MMNESKYYETVGKNVTRCVSFTFTRRRYRAFVKEPGAQDATRRTFRRTVRVRRRLQSSRTQRR